MYCSSPILLLIFNRPDLTERVFARIRESRPTILFVAADGPRSSKAGESEQCALSRAVTERIDWPCDVKRLYRDGNLGCKVAVSEGIRWFFDNVEEGIILEDDCLPDPLFFAFCDVLLEKYRNTGEVMQIGGMSFKGERKAGNGSYFFTRYPNIWGWATWRRVWNEYDLEISLWPEKRDKVMNRQLTRRARKMISNTFDEVKAGRIDTWDYQFFFQVLTTRGLAIAPQCNLVENIGFDERATHTKFGDSLAKITAPASEIFPLRHPDFLIADDEADRRIEEAMAPWRPLLERMRERIGQIGVHGGEIRPELPLYTRLAERIGRIGIHRCDDHRNRPLLTRLAMRLKRLIKALFARITRIFE